MPQVPPQNLVKAKLIKNFSSKGMPGRRGIAELPQVRAPAVVLCAERVATDCDLPFARAFPEQVAGVLDDSQAITLIKASEDQRRGRWKVPPSPRGLGRWVADA